MSTDTPPREADTAEAGTWLADVIARFGQPRVSPAPGGHRMRTEQGACQRSAWVWFPERVNHHVSIDRYGRWATITVGSHARGGTLEWTTYREPTSEMIRAMIALAWGEPDA